MGRNLTAVFSYGNKFLPSMELPHLVQGLISVVYMSVEQGDNGRREFGNHLADERFHDVTPQWVCPHDDYDRKYLKVITLRPHVREKHPLSEFRRGKYPVVVNDFALHVFAWEL
jgi:hypothetical protein